MALLATPRKSDSDQAVALQSTEHVSLLYTNQVLRLRPGKVWLVLGVNGFLTPLTSSGQGNRHPPSTALLRSSITLRLSIHPNRALSSVRAILASPTKVCVLLKAMGEVPHPRGEREREGNAIPGRPKPERPHTHSSISPWGEAIAFTTTQPRDNNPLSSTHVPLSLLSHSGKRERAPSIQSGRRAP